MHNLFHLDQILGPTICIHDQMPLKSCASKAGIAQLVERNLAKVEVASSNLVFRSKQQKSRGFIYGFLVFGYCLYLG